MTRASLLLVGLLAAGAVAQPPKPLIEQIEDAWKARADKVKSAVFELEVEEYYPKGSISEEHKKNDAVIPEKDTRVKFRARCVVDGEKIRLEQNGTRWNGKAFAPTSEVVIYTPAGSKRLQVVDGAKATGHDLPRNDYLRAKLEPFAPVMVCYRSAGIDRLRVHDLGQYTQQGPPAQIRGRTCQPIVWRGSAGESQTLWVDPAHGSVVVKDLFKDRHGQTTEYDLEYKPGADGIPLLSNWSARNLRAGRTPGYSWSVTVTAIRLNERPAESEFDLSFPAGTLLADRRRERPDVVVVQPDGSRVSATGQTAEPTSWWANRWLWAGAVAFAGTVVCLRIRKRTPSGSAASIPNPESR